MCNSAQIILILDQCTQSTLSSIKFACKTEKKKDIYTYIYHINDAITVECVIRIIHKIVVIYGRFSKTDTNTTDKLKEFSRKYTHVIAY